MAASANPSANHESPPPQSAPNSTTENGMANNPSSTNNNITTTTTATTTNNDNSQPKQSTPLKHNPGVNLDWSPEEQSTLEELLVKFASEPIVRRYAMIATKLKDKTVRDVALRCSWMNRKENRKRRKEDNSSARKNKDRKEKATDSLSKPSAHLAARSNGPSAAPLLISDMDDGISFKDIGGVTGELLEQNAQMFNQISANLASFQVHDNLNLLGRTRDNILAILNDMKDMPEEMKQMPPLPVKINEDLANTILPWPSNQVKPELKATH